jgi:hypothetical protein
LAYLCPDLPGIIPRFGTSFRPCGPFAAFRRPGSNPGPFVFANGFSPAMAGFPVFVFGMICPCLEMETGRKATTNGAQAETVLSIVRVLLG